MSFLLFFDTMYFTFSNKDTIMIYRDMHGEQIKHGDTIKTERGVVLDIIFDVDDFYFINSGNGQRNSLSFLDVGFSILKD